MPIEYSLHYLIEVKMGSLQLLLIFTSFWKFINGAVDLNDFYPYGVGNGDSQLPISDDGFINVALSSGGVFRFINSSYSAFFINNNGGISFDDGVSSYIPNCGASNVPMIIPFWADIDTRVGGLVHYRESTDVTLLRQAAAEISSAFPSNRMNLGWIFVITWENVGFYGARLIDEEVQASPTFPPNEGSNTMRTTQTPQRIRCDGRTNRNTFQLVLTTDGINTYSVFNYNSISWTTATSSGGDRCTGLNQHCPIANDGITRSSGPCLYTSYQYGIAAKAGVDFGDGRTFYSIDGSCSADIVNVTQTSNVGKPGKWIFKIDEVIETASGCLSTDRMKIEPAFVSVLGREIITLTVPCVEGAVNLSCLFYDPIPINVDATLGPNSTFNCRVPYLSTTGRIKVELAISMNTNNLSNVITKSSFIYTSDGNNKFDFTLLNRNGGLKVVWNPNHFTGLRTYQLKLSAVEYNYTAQRWVERGILKIIDNTNDLRRGIFETEMLSTVLILKSLKAPSFLQLEVVSEQEFLGTRLITNIFSNSFSSLLQYDMACLNWYESESVPLNDTLPCPPRSEDARIDQNFERETNYNLHRFHPGAEFSYRQRIPSQSGAGQQCVYKSGTLLMGRMSGGSVDKFSTKSSQGFMKHILYDILPWVWCCEKSSVPFEYCELYYERRPSDSGIGYRSPNRGNMNGDPHINTFDGLSYTFNGVGEYWLTIVKEPSKLNLLFSSQARMEQYINPSTNVSTLASVFTAVAFQQKNLTSGATVQAQVSVANSSLGLAVLFNNEALPALPSNEIFSFSEQAVGLSMDPLENAVVLTFASGFTFTIIAKDKQYLEISASALKDELQGAKIAGLLGNFDGIPSNDLTTPDGTIIPSDSNLEQIHRSFGSTWRTTANDSIFQYPAFKSHVDYQKLDFTPSFTVPDLTNVPQNVRDACGSSTSCLYDYVNTGGQLSFAVETLKTEIKFDRSVELAKNPAKVCAPPPESDSGWYEYQNYLLGSKLRFQCDYGSTLVGDSYFTCEETTSGKAEWNISVTPSCINNYNYGHDGLDILLGQ